MKRRYHRALIFAAILASPAATAEQPVWKAGPGTMNLGGRAELQVPTGYFYREWPPVARPVNPAKPALGNVIRLGTVRKDSPVWSMDFSYVPDSYPRTTQMLWRAEAFLHLDTRADAVARALSTNRLAAAKVLDSDRFDSRTASLDFAIGLFLMGRPGNPPVARRRARFFFGRGGTVVAESVSTGPLFATADREYETLLHHFSFAPGEGPPWLDRVPLMASKDIRPLPLYALGGLLAGVAAALFRKRRVLRLRAAT